MLNCHANDAVQCHTEEAFKKSLETRKSNGSLYEAGLKARKKAHTSEVRKKAVETIKNREGGYRALLSNAFKVCRTAEVIAKQVKSRKDSGYYAKVGEILHTPEAMKKSVETRRKNGTLQSSVAAAATPEARKKAIETRRNSARKVICVENGFIGCTPEIQIEFNLKYSKAANIVYTTYLKGCCSYNGLNFKIFK